MLNRIAIYFNKICNRIFVKYLLGFPQLSYAAHSVSIIGKKNIVIGKNVKLFKYAELDTRYHPALIPYNQQRQLGKISIGNNANIKDFVKIYTYNGFVTIGDNFSINPFSIIYGHGGVTIGNNVMIAAHTIIVSSSHNFSDTTVPINSSSAVSVFFMGWIIVCE